jgi:hypothetical protein
MKFQLQNFVQIVDSKEDLVLEMKEIYIKEIVMQRGNKLFLFIHRIRILKFMIQKLGGVIVGMHLIIELILIFEKVFFDNLVN